MIPAELVSHVEVERGDGQITGDSRPGGPHRGDYVRAREVRGGAAVGEANVYARRAFLPWRIFPHSRCSSL